MQKKGFTLIELLLVVSIIAILSLMALVSFSGVTRSMKLDIATDTLVSAIKQQQGLVKSGRVDVTSTSSAGDVSSPVCQGLRFSIGSTDNSGTPVQMIKAKFNSVGLQKANYCESITSNELTAYTGATDFKVISVKVFDSPKQSVDIVFKPPFAQAEVSSENELTFKKNILLTSAIKDPNIVKLDLQAKGDISKRIIGNLNEQVVITIASVSDLNEQQYIIFDPQSGLAYKTNSLSTGS